MAHKKASEMIPVQIQSSQMTVLDRGCRIGVVVLRDEVVVFEAGLLGGDDGYSCGKDFSVLGGCVSVCSMKVSIGSTSCSGATSTTGRTSRTSMWCVEVPCSLAGASDRCLFRRPSISSDFLVTSSNFLEQEQQQVLLDEAVAVGVAIWKVFKGVNTKRLLI